MDKGSILVKKVCGENSTICDFEAIIHTEVPIKEVYEIRHQILKTKVLFGKNAIVFFGRILIKAYCINSENLKLFLSEQTVSYKGFIHGEFEFHKLNPQINVKSKLEDIFIEVMESNRIKMTGIISTELLFCIEKVIKLSQLENSQDIRGDSDLNQQWDNKDDDYSACTMDNKNEGYEETEEIRTEVNLGTNQEFTIILD